jgi:hypothetical protein
MFVPCNLALGQGILQLYEAYIHNFAWQLMCVDCCN